MHLRFTALLLIGIVAEAPAFSQVTNKPAHELQVNAPAANTAGVPPPYLPGMNVNYVRTREALVPIIDENVFDRQPCSSVEEATAYFDGLGRPLQTVLRQASGGTHPKDIVSAVIYDAFGREAYKYLPYVQMTGNAGDGSFKYDPFGSQNAFYADPTLHPGLKGEQVYYGKTEFEASPLNRVVKTMPAGNNWAGSDRGISRDYRINEAADEVRIWDTGNDALTYDGAGNIPYDLNVPSSPSAYEPGQLYENETTGENGYRTVAYTDKEGKVVLKKVQIEESPSEGHRGWLCTYYVYDDLGQLRWVIPPKAVEAMLDAQSWELRETVIRELCFHYEYDSRQQMIAKKVPGCGWVYMVYDKRDRLTFTQDAALREKRCWMYTTYDDLNRPQQTGIMSGYGGNRTGLSVYLSGLSVNATRGVYVYDHYFPPGARRIPLLCTLYDSYQWTPKTYTPAYNSRLDKGENMYGDELPAVQNNNVKGLVTGTMVSVLSSNDIDGLGAAPWIETASFYDDKGRVVQTISDNYKGGQDILTSMYGFTGKVLCTYQVHNNAAANVNDLTVKTNMNYDAAGRLLSIRKKAGDNAVRTIEENSYDDLGQLLTKKIGQKKNEDGTLSAEPLEEQACAYNIRGWLKGLNWEYAANGKTHAKTGKWFAMDLSYDWGFDNNQYNGNIAGMRWQSGADKEERAYGFGYDGTGRLLFGDFKQYDQGNNAWNNSAGTDFSMKMGDGINANTAYDANGNIVRMQQWGLKRNSSLQIDDLSYSYFGNSNKLQKVDDAITGDNRLGDFTDKNTGDDYGYDVNGNLITDNNKRISGPAGIDLSAGAGAIEYNHLNLPYRISVKNDNGNSKGTITYIYDASGNKLEKITDEPAGTANNNQAKRTYTTYLGGFQYENNELKFFGHEEGRIRPKRTMVNGQPQTEYVYDYFIKDHLGNVRMVLTEEQQSDIYPAATLETDGLQIEKDYYAIEDGNVADKTSIPGFMYAANNGYPNNNNNNTPVNNNPLSNTSKESERLYRLNGANGAKTGLGIALKVMAGDQVQILGKSYYHLNSAGPVNNNYPIVAENLLNAFGATSVAQAKAATGALLNASPVIAGEVSSILSKVPGGGNDKPKAAVNWLLFDEQFRPVTSGSSYDAVGDNSGEIKDHLQSADISRNGYLYVYCSNESDIDVFFDNLQVVHTRGPLLEETHYYPFGLTMAGISSRALNFGNPENKRKYNGIELDNDLDINTYEAFYRNLDPQIGRWWQIDPKCEANINPDAKQEDGTVAEGLESMSPYTSMGDNPIKHSDPKGDIFGIDNLIGAAIGAAIDYGSQVVSNYAAGKSLKESFIQVDGKAIAISAAIGFATSGVANIAGKVLTKAGSAVVTKLEPTIAKLIVKQAADLGEKGLANTEVSVLGKIGRYEQVAKKLGAKSFQIPPEIAERMGSEKVWEANVKFLDRMISRGDKIVLDAPIKSINDVSGGFRKELNYLVEKGFHLSKDGTMMIK